MSQTNRAGLSLAILTTAIGATVAGPVQAALVSEAPAGFTPVTVTAISGNYTFDLDGNGSNDFALRGDGSNITLRYVNPTTSGAATFAGTLTGYASPSSLAIGNIKTGTVGYINSNFGTTPGEFAGLATNATFDGSYATAGTLGYIQGTYTSAGTPSFQLLDYGLVNPASAVPEPASLALLATGAAGIAALRRRRAANAQAKAA